MLRRSMKFKTDVSVWSELLVNMAITQSTPPDVGLGWGVETTED